MTTEPVTAVAEPTLEQLENVALALGLPLLPESLRPPFYRESLLNLHGLYVRVLNGDARARAAVERIRYAFGAPAGGDAA